MIELKGLDIRVGTRSVRADGLLLERGGHARIVGPTGAGKTTLLECICGLIRPAAGSVWIDGRDVTDAPPGRRGIGYAPQTPALFTHLSVRQNIGFGLTARRVPRNEVTTRVEALADLLRLTDVLGRRPQGLSGGEQRRVAIARAIAFRPAVLVLDEPAAGLDASAASWVAQLIQVEREAGATILEATHDTSTSDAPSTSRWQLVVRDEVAFAENL